MTSPRPFESATTSAVKLPSDILADRTRAVDQMVIQAHEAYLAPGFRDGLAVVAVGGFGRRELFPHSDVDVLVLFEKEAVVGAAKEAVAGFLRALWEDRKSVV